MSFQDCHTVDLDRPAPMDRVIPAFFTAAPAWVDRLMAMRNALMAPLGLKTAPMGPCPPPPYAIGQTIGLFRIIELGEAEVVFGEDDRHLDFRVTLTLLPGNRLAIATRVVTHNALGRLYLTAVKPFHQMIAATMARNTARRLNRGE
jgi:hypothetical protein